MKRTRTSDADDGADDLVGLIRGRLLPVLVARWGVETGSDVCADVEEYAWSHRRRLASMDNPLGYLYRVSQSKARRYTRWSTRSTFPSRFPELAHHDTSVHDVLAHLGALGDEQRICVLMVHAYGWTYDEVAEVLGVTRSVVNHHIHRGLQRLRRTTAHDPLIPMEDPR